MEEFTSSAPQSQTGDIVSTAEADAVIKLWMQRQRDAQERLTQPNVEDLAEALGTTPTEIRRLLEEVRKPVPATPASSTRKRRFRLLGPAIAGTTIALATVGVWAARRAVQDTPTPAAVVATTGEAPVAVQEWTDSAEAAPAPYVAPIDFPAGVTVEFRGAQRVGNHGGALSETQLAGAFKRVIDDYAPGRTTPSMDTTPELSNLRQALRNGKPEQFGRLVAFEQIQVFVGEKLIVEDVPIPLTDARPVADMILEEQQTRLRILANKVLVEFKKQQ